MTFEDDFIQLEFLGGTKRIGCKANGIEWPPPEKLELAGYTWDRQSMSAITDEQREGLTMLMRGAAYQLAPDQTYVPPGTLN